MATFRDKTQIKVSNYLVPATGGTAAVNVKYAGDGTADLPINFDWGTYNLDGEPFQPSGFYAANFSNQSVYIKISGNDLIFEVPANTQMGRMYPAPFEHTASIYGAGDAEIVFVNSPVIPYGLERAGLVDISAGFDSVGNELPVGFDSYTWGATYNADNTIATETRTDGSTTWTRTYTYVAGNVTAISQWVTS